MPRWETIALPDGHLAPERSRVLRGGESTARERTASRKVAKKTRGTRCEAQALRQGVGTEKIKEESDGRGRLVSRQAYTPNARDVAHAGNSRVSAPRPPYVRGSLHHDIDMPQRN